MTDDMWEDFDNYGLQLQRGLIPTPCKQPKIENLTRAQKKRMVSEE